MKVLIYSDIHISQDSSIVKGFKGKYSTRLYYIINSINWAEELADELGCDYIFNLGDTFDKSTITAIEATAIQDIKWSNKPHYILVGNHDSNVASLEYSSSAIFKQLNFNIIDKPFRLDLDNCNLLFLPYILETDRKKLIDYWGEYNENKNNIILSHNDLAGFNFGKFVSKEGFDIVDIDDMCNLYLNGHLHNTSWITDKILNVGNLCGQNFSEDAKTYKHGVWVLDTDTLNIMFYENPFALNFYKLDVDKNIIDNLENYTAIANSVLMLKCERDNVIKLKEKLEKIDNIVASRIIVYNDVQNTTKTTIEIKKIDYINEFKKHVYNNLGKDNIIEEEVEEICKWVQA